MHLHIAGCHLPDIQEHRSTCRTLQCLNIWQEDGRNADHLCTHQYLKKNENSYKINVSFDSFQIFQCRCQGIGPMHVKQGPIFTTVTYTLSDRIFFKLVVDRIVLCFTNVRTILFTNFEFFSATDIKLCLSKIEKNTSSSIPVQFLPSPVKPGAHSQVYDPSVFEQTLKS